MISEFSRVWSLLDRQMRWGAVGVLLLTLLTSVTDAFSIAVVVPVIRVAIDPGVISRLPVVGTFAGWFGDLGPVGTLVLVCGLLVGFFIVKNALSLLLLWQQQKFIATNRARMSVDLVHYYLESPLIFHLRTNSATLFRNAVSAVIDLFQGSVQSLFTLITEAVVAVVALIILVVAEPKVALATMAILAVAGVMFQKLLRAPIARLGKDSYAANERVIVEFNHAFGSIKETKVLRCEEYFAGNFAEATNILAVRQTRFAVLAQSPRMFIEVVGVLGLVVAILAMTSSGRGFDDMLAIMGMFAMAAMRLMPSLSRMANALGNLHFNFSMTEELSRDLADFRSNRDRRQANTGERLPFGRDIVVDGVSFRYPATQSDTLHDIHMRIGRGQSVAIVGASGSGKTTLSDILLGLLPPSGGQVTVDGTPITAANVRAWQNQIGLVTDAVYLIDDTLRRNVAFGIADSEVDPARLDRAVTLAQLDEVVARLPDGLDTIVGERGTRLSGGQRQRVAIARCLYREARVLVLDEATSALDAETEAAITAGIERLHGDHTLIVIAHRLSTVRHCDRVHFMSDGRLVDSGTFDELAGRNVSFREMIRQMDLSSATSGASSHE